MPSTCPFCAIIRGERPTVTILETERLIAFLDHRPVFRGHTLLVPKQHVQLLSELPAEHVPEFFTTDATEAFRFKDRKQAEDFITGFADALHNPQVLDHP